MEATYLICGHVFDLLVPELLVVDVTIRLSDSASLSFDDASCARSSDGSRLHDTCSSSRYCLLGVSVGESIQERYEGVLLDIRGTRQRQSKIEKLICLK